MNEHELIDLLDRSSADLAPDVDRLVGAGAARGRRSLRRRRLGTALAAAAVVGALGASATLLAGGGDGRARDDSQVAATPTPTEEPDVAVDAELRPVDDIHRDIQRLLGPGTSDLLQGLSSPRVARNGRDLSWFFRFADAEAQVSVHPAGRGCTPPGEEVPHQTGCLETGGVEYRTAGPWPDDGPGRWGQTVVAWQHGYEIMVISTNIHQVMGDDDVTTTRVADEPTITMDQLIALATSDIWFEQ